MKTFVFLLICSGIAMIVFAVSVSFSGQSEDGEELFQSRCGTCHKSGGESTVFAPVKYASVQWNRFFERNKHRRKKDISSQIGPDELEKIKQYLVDHAADSDRPIAAGLR